MEGLSNERKGRKGGSAREEIYHFKDERKISYSISF